MDDLGADTDGGDATSDMMENDPGTINPQNKQGYGVDKPTSISDIIGRSVARMFISSFSILHMFFKLMPLMMFSIGNSTFYFLHFMKMVTNSNNRTRVS